MSWPAVVIWLLIFGAFLSRGPALLYVFAATGVFGSLQMIPADRFNVLPQSVAALFLVAKIFSRRDNWVRAAAAAVDPSRLGLFAAFALYAACSALLLPRLFQGAIDVVPVTGDVNGVSVLRPTAGNINQLAYLLITSMTLAGAHVIADNPALQRSFLRAMLVFGTSLVLTGLVDLVSFRIGHSEWLAPFRTASYELLTDNEVGGAKRVVGLMPEASAYGSLCVASLSSLVFVRPCFDGLAHRLLVPAVILGLLVVTLLSTSTAAYVGLACLFACAGFNLVRRHYSRVTLRRRPVTFYVIGAAMLALGAAVLLVFDPALADPIVSMFHKMILEKSESQSYLQRGMWTQAGWQAFLDSGGIGVGLGSVRTSNWFVSILASTGVTGAALVFAFIGRLLVARIGFGDPWLVELIRGLRFALLPSLVMSYFAGTIPDIGAWQGATLGFLQGLICLSRLAEARAAATEAWQG